MIGEFKDFLKSQDIAYTDQDIAGVRDWINANITSEIFTSQFGQQEGLKVRAEWDPMIQKASDLSAPGADSRRERREGRGDEGERAEQRNLRIKTLRGTCENCKRKAGAAFSCSHSLLAQLWLGADGPSPDRG